MTKIPSEHELVSKAAEFLLRSRPEVFMAWPRDTMCDWLRYHLRQRAVGIVVNGGNIEAVGVGWRSQLPDIDDRWAKWDDKGDCFYFDQLHASNPEALANLILLFTRAVQDWQELRLIAHRHGRRVLLKHQTISRFYRLSKLRA